MKKLVIYLTINRIALFFLFFIISKIKPFTNFILTFGHRWDSNSYIFIATHGYVTYGSEKNFIVFPPLYPALIKIVSLLKIDFTISGMIVSNIFFVLGMLVLYKLIKETWSEKIARLTIILISIFPTTYFLSVSYPESLFIFLFALSFLFASKKAYLLAAIFCGLAASTRPFGLIIFPSIVAFIINSKMFNIKNVVLVSLLFLIPLLPYISINYFLFGNPLAFEYFLKQNWGKSFNFPWNGIVDSWKRGIFTTDSVTYKYFVGYTEAITSTLSWIFVLLGVKKWKIKSPYLVYLFLGTLFFTSTGFILSAPRYLLSIPPFFILLAEILNKNKILKFVWIGISLGLLIWFSHDFALGMWAF